MLSQMKNKLIKIAASLLVFVFLATAVFGVAGARKAQAFACLVPGPCQIIQAFQDAFWATLVSYAKQKAIQVAQNNVLKFIQGENKWGIPLFIQNYQVELFEVAQKYAYSSIDKWLKINLCSNIDDNLKQSVLRIVQINLNLVPDAPDCAIVPTHDWNILKDGWDYYYGQLGDKNQRMTGILANALGIGITLQSQKQSENAVKAIANQGSKNVECTDLPDEAGYADGYDNGYNDAYRGISGKSESGGQGGYAAGYADGTRDGFADFSDNNRSRAHYRESYEGCKSGSILVWTKQKLEDIKTLITSDATQRNVGSFLGNMIGNLLTQELDNRLLDRK